MHNELGEYFWKSYNIWISIKDENIPLYETILINKELLPFLDLGYLIYAYANSMTLQEEKSFYHYSGKGPAGEYVLKHRNTKFEDKFVEKKLRMLEYSCDNDLRSKKQGFEESKRLLQLRPLQQLREKIILEDGTVVHESLDDQIKEYAEMNFKPLRKAMAIKALEQAGVKRDKLVDSQKLLFEEVIQQLCKNRKLKVTPLELRFIQFLESLIRGYYPFLLLDLDIKPSYSLKKLRCSSDKKWNAVCERCCLKLKKHDDTNICTRRTGSRSCQEARQREQSFKDKIEDLSPLSDEGRLRLYRYALNLPDAPDGLSPCEQCGEETEHTILHKKVKTFFCTNTCFEKYRKRRKT